MADLMQDRCDTEVQDADNRQLRCVRPPGHKTVGYWVATGKLTPLRYGRSGAGNGHVFSGAVVAAFLHQRENGGAW